jgi:predicted PurR-regulated permease PerM
MHLTLLPAARRVYAYENTRLTAASARATGLPLAAVTLAAGLALGFVLYRSQRWLSRRTHRTFNVGLLLASVAGVAVLTLAMAAGCAWGLSRRLAEYR